MYDNILIPTDGNENTPDAVLPGIELASQHGATVHVLHVVENEMLRTVFTPRSMRSMAVDSRSTGEEAVAAVQQLAEDHGVETTSWVLRAPPSLVHAPVHETIVEYAETNDVDLIVMGSTGRGWLSTLLRPSITQRVMSSTDIPVYGRRLPRDSQYGADRSTGARGGPDASD
jgi:nucleotide-binding universal stress UspA family protein